MASRAPAAPQPPSRNGRRRCARIPRSPSSPRRQCPTGSARRSGTSRAAQARRVVGCRGDRARCATASNCWRRSRPRSRWPQPGQAGSMRRAGPGHAASHGSGANRVEIKPPAMLNCAMVAQPARLDRRRCLQPAAEEAFGSSHRPPAQRLGIFLPQSQRQPSHSDTTERTRAGQRHRHRRLRHRGWPHDRGGAPLGADVARSAARPTGARPHAARRAKSPPPRPKPRRPRPVPPAPSRARAAEPAQAGPGAEDVSRGRRLQTSWPQRGGPGATHRLDAKADAKAQRSWRKRASRRK